MIHSKRRRRRMTLPRKRYPSKVKSKRLVKIIVARIPAQVCSESPSKLRTMVCYVYQESDLSRLLATSALEAEFASECQSLRQAYLPTDWTICLSSSMNTLYKTSMAHRRDSDANRLALRRKLSYLVKYQFTLRLRRGPTVLYASECVV